MNINRQRILFVTIALCLSFTSGAIAIDRTADEIITELESIKMLTYDRSQRSDKELVAKIREENLVLNRKKAELIGELFKVAPDHKQLAKLMPKRWGILGRDSTQASVIADEMTKILADAPDTDLAKEARYAYAIKRFNKNTKGKGKDIEAASKAVESFVSRHSKDTRSVRMLQNLARAYEFGSKEQLSLYSRIMKDYPKNSKYMGGKIKQIKTLGKPFDLEFQDAITGTTVSIKALKGQVVVIDFWATWCGPCIAEMPHMKELYAKYHDEGVQFIGISLDSPEDKGGLEKLRKYVDEKKIPWPQYYQGDGWASEFSTSWGINSIPSLFIVDKNGNLKSVKARGKLEKLIPELLAE